MLDLYNMQNAAEQEARNRDTRDVIARGTHFSLLSLTAASYIDPGVKRHWDALKPKLQGGCFFRLLLLNPFCHEAQVRDQVNAVPTRYDSKFRLDLIIELYNRYPNVSVKFASMNIYGALFFTHDEMFYD